jgi:hypothetical protein
MRTFALARLALPPLVATLVTFAVSLEARALPAVGAAQPEVKLQDSWDRTLVLSRLRGRPTLLLYETKDSAAENAPLKAELAELAKGGAYRRSIALVAIADVSGYDYWPVRGFVKDALKDESNKQGTDIYCDWDGGARGALGLDRDTSNVVLYDRGGRVLFASRGALNESRRGELLALLRAQLLPP